MALHRNLRALTHTLNHLGCNLLLRTNKKMLEITFPTRGSYPTQPSNRIGRESQNSSMVAYIVTDDENLGTDVASAIEARGIRAKWFKSALEYLVYNRPEGPSCLFISRGLLDPPGLDLKRMLAYNGNPPVIVLSDGGDIPSCVRAIKEGAHDFLTLPLIPSHLMDAMNAAFQKDREALVMRRKKDDLRSRWRSLTSREAEVMRYVVGGFLNKQTAAELGITENTVQVHRGRLMKKMQADSFAALVRMALKLADWGENSLLDARADHDSANAPAA